MILRIGRHHAPASVRSNGDGLVDKVKEAVS